MTPLTLGGVCQLGPSTAILNERRRASARTDVSSGPGREGDDGVKASGHSEDVEAQAEIRYGRHEVVPAVPVKRRQRRR